jgi:hypothetical protein
VFDLNHEVRYALIDLIDRICLGFSHLGAILLSGTRKKYKSHSFGKTDILLQALAPNTNILPTPSV